MTAVAPIAMAPQKVTLIIGFDDAGTAGLRAGGAESASAASEPPDYRPSDRRRRRDNRDQQRQRGADRESRRRRQGGLNRPGNDMRGQSQFVARMRREGVLRRQLLRDLGGPAAVRRRARHRSVSVHRVQRPAVRPARGVRGRGRLLPYRPANSPTRIRSAAIDVAPATRPATPATSTSLGDVDAAATPTTRLAVEMMPSMAPSTAARSQPMRSMR